MRSSRRKCVVRVAIVMAGAISCSGTAVAQAAGPSNRPELNLTALVRYDSNVAGTTAAQAAARGLEQANEHFRLGADVDIARRVGIFDLSLIGLAGYNFYVHNTRLNREQIALDGAVLANLSRCQVNLTGSLHRAQSDLSEISIVAAPGIDSVRNVETRVLYGAAGSCGGDIGFRPGLGFERETGTNSAALRKFSDFDRMSYTGSLTYAGPVFGKLSLLATSETVDYPNRPRIAGREDGYVLKSGGVRFERDIGANLRGSAQVNYTSLQPRRAGVADFDGITYSADLTATFADRLQLHALILRDTKPSLQSDGAYSIRNSYGLDATYAASQRLSFGLGGAYRTTRYPGAGALPGVALTDDARTLLNGNVTLRANERLKFVLDGTYVTRDAAGTFYDSDNTGASLSASLAL